MQEGMYLGQPPVDVGRARARVLLQTMLRGGASYGRAAGLGPPLAMPMLQPGFPREPANPNYNPTVSVLHPLDLTQARLNLAQRFGLKTTGGGNAS